MLDFFIFNKIKMEKGGIKKKAELLTRVNLNWNFLNEVIFRS